MYKLRKMCREVSEENHSVEGDRTLQIIKESMLFVWSDIKKAKWAIIAVIAYFVFSRELLNSSCPLVWTTGFPCPACGLTRAGLAALSLRFGEAWQIHPFIYPIALWVVLFLFQRYVRKKRRLPKWLVRLGTGILLGMVVFYFWRMYRYFPGDPPISYYRGSVLWQILRWIHP